MGKTTLMFLVLLMLSVITILGQGQTDQNTESNTISGHLQVSQDNKAGDFDIYVNDLKTGEEKKLTGEGDQVSPTIDGNLIAWQDLLSEDFCYYFFDKKWGKCYPRPGIQSQPMVSGKYIIYTDEDGSTRNLDISNWRDELVLCNINSAN
jgi:hypothetical protein